MFKVEKEVFNVDGKKSYVKVSVDDQIVVVSVLGPDKTIDATVTRREAEGLRDLLDIALRGDEH